MFWFFLLHKGISHWTFISYIAISDVPIFIGLRSDHSEPMSVTHSLTTLWNQVDVWPTFLQFLTWIFPTWYMNLSKILHGFVKIVTCISCPLLNQTKLKFDQDFSWLFWTPFSWPSGRLSPKACHTYGESIQFSASYETSDFDGKLHLHFYSIWDCAL